jgi:plasmid stabilization system protein ParE
VTRVVVAPRAMAQVQTIGVWWRANRSSAPELFSRELAEALEALHHTPALGVRYLERGGVVLRRLLLPRTRYHVYFSYDAESELVEVRAVWHTARGSGPPLS